jgi:hypothetical protein
MNSPQTAAFDRLNVQAFAVPRELADAIGKETADWRDQGPNTGVFLQITAEDHPDQAVPGQAASFGIIKAAQARGDFDVLAERGRRVLRVHIKGNLAKGLAALADIVVRNAQTGARS